LTVTEGDAMGKCICTNCGYVYDPEKGDASQHVPPNTPFEALPDDWHCPICYVGKDMFDPLD
jgi:rubredoxin